MKILIILFFLHQDTSTVKLYQRIGQKTAQIHRQMARAHTIEDVYVLQKNTDKALMESHGLSKKLLISQDSLITALSQQKQLLNISLVNQKKMMADIKPATEARSQLEVLNRFMDGSVMWPFLIIIVYVILEIFYFVLPENIKRLA